MRTNNNQKIVMLMVVIIVILLAIGNIISLSLKGLNDTVKEQEKIITERDWTVQDYQTNICLMKIISINSTSGGLWIPVRSREDCSILERICTNNSFFIGSWIGNSCYIFVYESNITNFTQIYNRT